MKRISLKPYPGEVLVTRDRAEHARWYKKLARKPFSNDGVDGIGHMTFVRGTYLVYYRSGVSTLAHELGHVIMDLFQYIGLDPREAHGEAFCYLLGHLLDSVLKKK